MRPSGGSGHGRGACCHPGVPQGESIGRGSGGEGRAHEAAVSAGVTEKLVAEHPVGDQGAAQGCTREAHAGRVRCCVSYHKDHVLELWPPFLGAGRALWLLHPSAPSRPAASSLTPVFQWAPPQDAQGVPSRAGHRPGPRDPGCSAGASLQDRPSRDMGSTLWKLRGPRWCCQSLSEEKSPLS